MAQLLTSAQMRAIEGAAIASGTVTGVQLMERAGTGVVAAIGKEWPEFKDKPGRALVLAGPGNNGGDGYVIARLLKAQGWEITLVAASGAENLPPDARAMHDLWAEIGRVVAADGPEEPGGIAQAVGAADLVVDAVFGTGLTRPVDPASAIGGWLAALDAGPAPVVAVDIPSGLCADSGRVLGESAGGLAPRAALTVSFHAAKLGHVLAEGPERCGRLVVADIGLEAEAHGASGAVTEVTRADLAPDAPGTPPLMKRAGHKFDHGHALVLTGGMGRTGAARLAAGAALRIGAGLVTLAAPGAAMMECAAQITALMLRRCEGPEDLAALLSDARLTALCLGPGLGVERARDLVPVALASGRACVLDADALSAFAEAPEVLFAGLHAGCVLTPHDGEFARLFPDLAAPLRAPATRGPAPSRTEAARAAAVRAGCTVLLKGPDTVIAAPDGQVRVHAALYERAVPWFATAGAGDTLAGIITGLLARGFTAPRAAACAAWLHAEAARHVGPGLIAEDLAGALPPVLRDLS